MPILGHAKAPRESVVGLFRGQQESCFSQEQVKGREAGVGAGVDKVGSKESKAPRLQGVLGACGGWTRSRLKLLSREGM